MMFRKTADGVPVECPQPITCQWPICDCGKLADEREWCAQVAESYITLNTGDLSLAEQVANKIRNRKSTEEK
jgi:hypothetical protein